jgi:hypothetical protein
MNRIARFNRRSACARLLLILFCSANALADTAVCNGTLTTVGNHANGINGLYVVVAGSNIIKVCSFTTTQFTVTPDDCKHMANLAALAFATEATVTFYVDNAPSTSCTAIPSWHAANTRYFSVNK